MYSIRSRVVVAALALAAAAGVTLAARSMSARPATSPGEAPAGRAAASASPAAGTAVAPASTEPWEYCAAIGVIDRPDARYLGDGTRAVIQDALALAERLPQRFADPAARRVPVPWRCMGGAVWACDPGANLPCGAANASREPRAGMSTYCVEHPDGVLPAFVSGHDTIYAWSCRGGRAVIDRQLLQVDERGFVANFWYRLDRPR